MAQTLTAKWFRGTVKSTKSRDMRYLRIQIDSVELECGSGSQQGDYAL
jgi:hypothetical protein